MTEMLTVNLILVLKEKSMNDYKITEMFRYQDPFAGIKYIVIFQVNLFRFEITKSLLHLSFCKIFFLAIYFIT